jgi:dTDP-4-amino-4,6-dideoxygalactose transaminase
MNLAPWPYFTEDEKQAVQQVLESGKVNYWTGQEGRLFEKEFANYIGTDYAIAVANGTVALELCLIALGIQPGDEVIVTSRTFLASASAIVMRGAVPVFADVDLDSQNITAESIQQVITPKTKVIIAVHLAGWPCDMPDIMALAKQHDLAVIEDCAQSHGATINGKQTGSFGDMAAFSFCQDKIMTTGGEGGMVTTHNKALWEKAWSFKDHGKSYDTVYNKEHLPGFRWLHESFGTNWRLSEMQSAIGRKQLEKLEDWVAKRNVLAELYTKYLSEYAYLRIAKAPENMKHAYYKYYMFVDQAMLPEGWTRNTVVDKINQADIPCMQGSCSEIYKEKCFDGTGFRPEKDLLNAKQLGAESILLLVHPTIDVADLEARLKKLKKVL